ncbi:dihydrofolate reductase family protein [Glutamicibacter sp. ZJUTW]|uniref:dihydrofolate reductase family protein n=1 Tax=Glutamicibacter sp. ZJUTW TaxID=1155384 RepID=UPI0011F155B4|nr:dihydrofolate reductase family protein [Glutamicibacter sp. ZJUTW]QEP07117.1 dihydrofolate reductase family protein [Glutamicibacter sp. ZJUTW]
MRTLIATSFVSLDGVVEAPGGEPGYRNSGWTVDSVDFDPAAYELKGTEQAEASAMLLGRHSYESFSAVWPSMTDEFPQYNAMPKFVLSTTLREKDLATNWGETTILRSVADVARLRAGDGGPISIHGSATMVHSLQEHQLIDQYNLLVFPVLLGAGKRLFSDTSLDAQKLKLVDSQVYSNGIQKNIFKVQR